jgi:hypothetical protein
VADQCPKLRSPSSEVGVTDPIGGQEADAIAERLLGFPLVLPLGPGEPEVGNEFRRLATQHTYGDSCDSPWV